MADRTAELTQLALRYRSASTLYRDRFISPLEVQNTEKQFTSEASALFFRILDCERKVKTAQAVTKSSSLFDNKHYQLQTVTDAVEDEMKVMKGKLGELGETQWGLAGPIREILESRLYAVMREFKGVLQARGELLRVMQGKKGLISSATAQPIVSRFSPTFLPTSSQ